MFMSYVTVPPSLNVPLITVVTVKSWLSLMSLLCAPSMYSLGFLQMKIAFFFIDAAVSLLLIWIWGTVVFHAEGIVTSGMFVNI